MKRFLMVAVVVASMFFLAVGAQAALILNGGFEEGSYNSSANGGQFYTLSAGSSALSNWTIQFGSIDWIGSYWQNHGGQHSLDMSGNNLGMISQTFATNLGQVYEVSFYMAGNPAGGNAVKALIYTPNNNDPTYFTFNTAGHTRTNMGWELKTFQFRATSDLSTLTFTSLEPNAYGPALDDVSARAIPEPGTMMLLGSGLIGLAGWGRKKFRK